MDLHEAMKRAAALSRKGDSIALLAAFGGMPARVAMRREGFWASWVLGDGWPVGPHCTIEVGPTLSTILKSKLTLAEIYPLSTPCLTPGEWAPPWPASQLTHSVAMSSTLEAVLQLVHVAVTDPLRPELGCIYLGPEGAYAGGEAQFARLDFTLSDVRIIVPSHAFYKWPTKVKDAAFWSSHDRIYFQLDDELRTVALPGHKWWPTGVVDAVNPLCTKPTPSLMTIESASVLEAFKSAKTIGDRRIVALGLSVGTPWIHLGQAPVPLPAVHVSHPGVVWQTILDGNRLLDAIKAWPVAQIGLSFQPDDPTAPVCLGHPGYFEAIYPLMEPAEKLT